MRRGGAGLIAAVLALAGCKGTTPKPPDKDRGPAGIAAARSKAKDGRTPDWLDPTAKLPGAGTPLPKADSWTDPNDPGFNAAAEVKGVLAGRVLDPSNRGAKNIYIQIESADAGAKDGAPLGIQSDAAGYFMAKGLKPGQVYNLTAKAEIEGKPLHGAIQAKTPNPTLTISLRDDFAPLPSAAPIPGGGPPRPAAPAVPGVTPGEALPPPSAGDLIPPMGLGPTPVPARPADGAFAPGTGAGTRSIPPTLDPRPGSPPPGPPPVPTLPPDPAAPPKPSRPENTADGPAQPWKPPTVTIPGPPASPFPPSVPPLPPPTPVPGDPKKMSGAGRPAGNLALVDTLERPWTFAANRYGSVVLLDFLTTSCPPCKRAIPTLVDLQARYGADGLQLVGVVCDDVSQKERAALAAKYQRDFNLNYALYVEPGAEPGSARDRLGVQSYPTLILLDAAGKELWRGSPFDRDRLEAAVRQALGK